MREIIFRGKTLCHEEWEYGNLIILASLDNYMMIERNKEFVEKTGRYSTAVVVPETVGQYTGLKDKNDDRMWEGDIVKGLFYHERPVLAVVKFKDGAFGLEWDRSGAKTFSAFTSLCNIQYEKLGNIFDNPELLETNEQ